MLLKTAGNHSHSGLVAETDYRPFFLVTYEDPFTLLEAYKLLKRQSCTHNFFYMQNIGTRNMQGQLPMRFVYRVRTDEPRVLDVAHTPFPQLRETKQSRTP